MPDQDFLGDHLDRVAAPLRDATAGSVPPGAAAAIRRGRRRRAAGLVATGALAVAAVGGGVALAGPGGDGPGPDTLVAEAPPRALPEPALLTPAEMKEATEGWHAGWRPAGQMDDTLVEGCLEGAAEEDLPDPDPDPEIDVELVDADGTESFTALGQLGDAARARQWEETLIGSLSTCAEEQSTTDYAGGATVVHLQRASTGTDYWLARVDDRLAFSALGASGTTADETQATAVGDALVAALLEDDSFVEDEGPTG